MEPLSWLLLAALLVVTLTLAVTGARHLRVGDRLKRLEKELSEEQTTREKAERQLLDKEASRALAAEGRDALTTLLDAVPRPLWRREKDLNLTYCNEAYERAVDQRRAEILKRGT